MPISAPRELRSVLSTRGMQLHSTLSDEARHASIVIGVCLRNQAKHLRAALESAMTQTVVQQGRAVVVIMDDSSDDDWQERVTDYLSSPHVVTVGASCGSAARSRNALLDWVDAELPDARWVARLDADDLFADVSAVGALADTGEAAGVLYVLGSNYLARGGAQLPESNMAEPAILQDRARLLAFIERFCLHGHWQELPSCNLLLRTHSGIRYPDVRSAEDHWLVAALLMLRASEGLVVPAPVYAVYSLGGAVTQDNRASSHWARQRTRLATALRLWHQAIEGAGDLLGVGQEGVVWRIDRQVYKKFYPYAMDDADVEYLSSLNIREGGPLPEVSWKKMEDGCWRCSYPWFESLPLQNFFPAEAAKSFLKQMHEGGYVTCNVKRANLRVVGDRLVYIDIGKDIRKFTPSRFLDTAARLYSIGVLGQSDHELARRPSMMKPHEALARLPGFADFYRGVVEDLFPHCATVDDARIKPKRTETRVTLLIKCCAQDVALIDEQARYIVSQLSYPVSFARRVLLIDSHPGPFLRQYASGDLDRLLGIAKELQRQSVVDDVWFVPKDEGMIRRLYRRWFGCADIAASHTVQGAPLSSQLWAFDQVNTPYVLQCDSDVLIGRRDFEHDYLADMLEAIADEGVVSVGFNISQLHNGYRIYQGAPGQYPPEIRCGLLDLRRLKAQCPLPNTVTGHKFELMWHRSVQQQENFACRSVRGGDSRTFYLHPMNSDKKDPCFKVWRDLVAQGLEPAMQKGKWDLLATAPWKYPTRDEPLIFLLMGRCTPIEKLRRCFLSLANQNDQHFGLIVIDDASPIGDSWQLPLLIGPLKDRTTLIRRDERAGYIENFRTAVTDICSNRDSLIVTLDLDDALMSPRVTERLHVAIAGGADLVNGGMFRPDKPLHTYEPDYETPRQKGGGNVWAHMRGFRKTLFDALPTKYLLYQGQWVDTVTDYAIMLPLVEMAQRPVFIDELFCYYHQREPYTDQLKAEQRKVLDVLLDLRPLTQTSFAEPASGAAEGRR